MPRRRTAILGLGGGSIAVAAGYLLGLDIVVWLGAVVGMAGSFALVTYAWQIWLRRGRSTTDLGWHRFAIGGLISAITWFAIGMTILAGRSLAFGAAPEGWSIEPVLAPLVVGWIGLAIVASATHLIPAVGPGDQSAHARQLAILGRASRLRLVAADSGVAALAVGMPLGLAGLTIVGIALAGLAFAATALLLAAATWIGVRASPKPTASASRTGTIG